MFDGPLTSKAEELLRDLRGLDDAFASARREFDEETRSVRSALAEAAAEHERLRREREQTVANAQAKVAEAERELVRIREEIARRLAEAEATVEALVRDKVRGFEFVARAWADYELALANAQSLKLELKQPPAPRAAKVVRAKGAQVADARS